MDEKKLRVLLIAPPLEVVGGQSVQAARLVSALEATPGVSVKLMPSPPRLPAWLRPFQKAKLVRTILNAVAFQLKLLGKIGQVDVLHVFTPSYWAFLWTPAPSLAMARLFGRKSVLNYRDGRAEGHLRDWKTARPLISMADEVVAPSGYLVDVFGRFGLPASAIPNIIDPEQFTYRERRTIRPRFLHNRGLEPLYNVPCMLRAFAKVQQRYPEASLTVANDGPLRTALEGLARELELAHVAFVGQVSQQRMRELYDEVDIYWMCPNIDCMPGSVLEAYASGTPVISTEAGGVPYILRHEETGLLVEPDDHEDMAAAALRLLEEESLGFRLACAGRAELDKYEQSAVARQWVDLYRRLTSP